MERRHLGWPPSGSTVDCIDDISSSCFDGSDRVVFLRGHAAVGGWAVDFNRLADGEMENMQMKSADVDRTSTPVGDSRAARPARAVDRRGRRLTWRELRTGNPGSGDGRVGPGTGHSSRLAPGLDDLSRHASAGATPPTVCNSPSAEAGAHDDHAADDHAGHDEAVALELSEQARKNIGLTLYAVERREFARTVVVPAVISERPGRSAITVSAPMTGIVTRIYPIPGEAVAPGDVLFDLRLTHEDLVEKQSSLLRDLEQLDVVKQEVERLEDVTRSGAVAGKTLLERVYEQQKVEGAIRAEREALLLHGLSEEQIETVQRERRLIRQMVVTVPEPDEAHSQVRHEDFLQVSQLAVKRGDHVITGTPLLTLTDHCLLYIEGQAFEHDAEDLNRAANEGLPVSILIQSHDGGKQTVAGCGCCTWKTRSSVILEPSSSTSSCRTRCCGMSRRRTDIGSSPGVTGPVSEWKCWCRFSAGQTASCCRSRR